jgi:hypothetical protein
MSNSGEGNKMIGFSRHVYEKLLAAYPERFRQLYGEEMVDLFEDECRDQMENGSRFRLLSVWFKALADLSVSATLERGRISMDFSAVRWGGFLAIVGGFLTVVSNLLVFLLLQMRTEWMSLAVAGQIAGMLLIAGGVVGLVALIANRGVSGGEETWSPRLPSLRQLSWTQRSALAGFALAVVVIVATVGLMAVHLIYGVLDIGQPTRLVPGPLEDILYMTLGSLSGFGLPVAAILLGIAVWRSGLLGRWSALPIIVGTITILAPFSGIVVARLISDYVFSGSALELFVVVGIPQIVVGCLWMLLGFVLGRRESAAGQDLQLGASTS